MKKVLVIGCPGSGKSTFSRSLHNVTGIPLYHLDMLYWNSDKTTVEKNVFISRLTEVLNKDQWIIDGNFSSTMSLRLSLCDTVFFLDYPTDLCLEGVEERRGKKREDMPWIETEEDTEFTEFIKNFNTTRRPQILDLLEHYKDKNIVVFKSREQSADYFNELMSSLNKNRSK